MTQPEPQYGVRLARTADDLRAAQRLRYLVFVEELGASGAMVDHGNRLETDAFDPYFDHLLLIDHNRAVPDNVVGVYRLLRQEQARRAGQFYSEDEFDLSVLHDSKRPLLELGRSCLHPAYRGGMGMYHLWHALAEYVTTHGIEILFGVASFHGTEAEALAAPLSLLHHRHLAPADLRVTARPQGSIPMDRIAPDALDRVGAMLAVPALIKAYLRLGGFVGQGAYLDRAFNTTDVCLILDVNRMNATQRAIYTRPVRA